MFLIMTRFMFCSVLFFLRMCSILLEKDLNAGPLIDNEELVQPLNQSLWYKDAFFHLFDAVSNEKKDYIVIVFISMIAIRAYMMMAFAKVLFPWLLIIKKLFFSACLKS